jgi:hypothetical protein
LFVVDGHVFDFGGIDGVVFGSFELGEEPCEFDLDVFQGLLLVYPFWKATFRLLCIYVPALINIFILLFCGQKGLTK